MEQINVFDYFNETAFLVTRITNSEKRVLTDKYLQVGIYQTSTYSIEHPITDKDFLNYELKPAVIYDTLEEAASGFRIYE